jgi:hypothetical protein
VLVVSAIAFIFSSYGLIYGNPKDMILFLECYGLLFASTVTIVELVREKLHTNKIRRIVA